MNVSAILAPCCLELGLSWREKGLELLELGVQAADMASPRLLHVQLQNKVVLVKL